MSEGLKLRFPNLGRFDVPTVDTGILGRIEDMYSGREGSTPKDSGGENVLQNTVGGIYGSATLGLIPGAGPALNALTSALTTLQGNTGLRSGRIRELASDPNKRGTYDSGSNTYSGLNILDRVMDIRPDAVTSQIASTRKRDLENSDAVRAIKLEKNEKEFNKIFPKGAATDNLEVEKLASQIDTRKDLISQIEKNQGTGLLTSEREKLGRNLTNDELRILNDKAKNSTPDALRVQAKSEAEVALAGKQGDAAVTNAKANTTTANASALNAQTSRIQAINADRLARAEIDYKNAQLKHNYDIAVFEANERAREANLDRTLRKDLSILGLEDKRDERRYDRERDERKDRQLMIMQLLGGLKNLGQSLII